MSPGVLPSGKRSPVQPYSLACTLSSYEPNLLVPSSGAFRRRVNQGWARSGSSTNVSRLLRTRSPGTMWDPSLWASRHHAEPGSLSAPPTVPVLPWPWLGSCRFSLVAEQLPSCLVPQFGSPQILLEAVRVCLTTSDSSLPGQGPCSQNIPQGPFVLCP